MDSAMSLFGSEFSLFGEDLLFSPTVPIDDGLVTLSQDGLKANPLSSALAWQTDELCIKQDANSNKQVTSGSLLGGWLDTPIDLLGLVAEQQPFTSSTAAADLGLLVSNKDSSGLMALKIEAEKTSLELSTTNIFEQLTAAIRATPQELSCQGSENVYDHGLGLLELLTSNASQLQAFADGELADLDCDQNMDSSDAILSHMSIEDVESILSSGPSSPESLVTEESFESLMSSVITSDNSFDTSANIMNEVSLVEDNTLSTNSAILDRVAASADNKSVTSKSSEEEDVAVEKSRVKSLPHNNKGASSKFKKEPEHRDASGIVRVADRKLRKKQQNKDAATRYRIKKKFEQELIDKDVSELEDRNNQLKDRVEEMTKEIQYLKTLISDVYKAQTQVKKST